MALQNIAMDFFTIKELENLSGIKAHTLRIWEQRYGFIKPARTDTNIRYYNNEELKKILNISLLNKNGYKISHISEMSEQQIRQAVMALKDEAPSENKLINSLLQKMIEVDPDGFEKILNSSLQQYGTDKTMEAVVFPLLSKIGTLWATSGIMPAQEHLVSNIIRQKILAAADQLSPAKSTAPAVLMFLPEGERHELGLLYMYYKLRKIHLNVLYAGADVPIQDVAELLSRKKPAYIYLHITGSAPFVNLADLIKRLAPFSRKSTVIITGEAAASYSKKHPGNMLLQLLPAQVPGYIQTGKI